MYLILHCQIDKPAKLLTDRQIKLTNCQTRYLKREFDRLLSRQVTQEDELKKMRRKLQQLARENEMLKTEKIDTKEVHSFFQEFTLNQSKEHNQERHESSQKIRAEVLKLVDDCSERLHDCNSEGWRAANKKILNFEEKRVQREAADKRKMSEMIKEVKVRSSGKNI
jgi:hypothetical protein